jgi:hypothetical protein
LRRDRARSISHGGAISRCATEPQNPDRLNGSDNHRPGEPNGEKD